MMEHIVQFAIGVDDERIQKIMEESAAQQILDDIKEFSHGKTYYGDSLNSTSVKLKEIFAEKISEYVKEHADEIVQLAVKEVAKNMMKTKKVKETLDKIAEGIVNG